MRIIEVKFSKDVSTYLGHVARRFRVRDSGFIEDLFMVIRSKGVLLPDKTAIDALIQREEKTRRGSATIFRVMANKRLQLLRAIFKTSVMQKSLALSNVNQLDLLERCLQLFRGTFSLVRESQCMTCHLISSCDFGKQYGHAVRNITKVMDPDYSKKVHDDCPLLPEIEGENQMASYASFMANLDPNALTIAGVPTAVAQRAVKDEEDAEETAEETMSGTSAVDREDFLGDFDEDADLTMELNTAAKSDSYNTSHVSGQLVNVSNTFIDTLTNQQLIIYMLALRLEATLESEKKDKYKPVPETTDHKKDRNIKSVSEVAHVKLSEHLKPEEVFDQKLAKKELIRTQHQKPDTKQQLLYLLLDTSFSMCSPSTRFSPHMPYVNRSSLASALSLALVRKVRREGGIIFLRCFEGHPGPLYRCETPEQFDRVEKHIALCGYDGSGTSLMTAMTTAAADINGTIAEKISQAEILMITDACDGFSPADRTAIRAKLQKVPLNILDVSGKGSTAMGQTVPPVNKDLVDLSDNYFSVKPETAKLSEIIQLIGGSKQLKK